MYFLQSRRELDRIRYQESRCDCSQTGGQPVLIQYSGRWLNVPVKFPILKPAKAARPESNAASLPQLGVKTELDNDVSATLKPTTSKLA